MLDTQPTQSTTRKPGRTRINGASAGTGETNYKAIYFVIEEDVHARFKKYCTENSLNISSLMRNAVLKMIEGQN